MQFDDLHNKLFALAKKGTQDQDYFVNPTSRLKTGRNKFRPKINDRNSVPPYGNNLAPASPEAMKNLKNLQFTLFD
ncbi:hypothetical protein [Muriicola sp. Z0-33]|uniref:hypothetical protein n=1 Tax=Muriicola sp. Z0-33 TaxID=2816957 RepID=UPI00223826C0|nr:hypothetical protein [Muriicola sp. Z0-33]MCW5515355.1 hypothetical protein [Muriicola sp. Z0-33]